MTTWHEQNHCTKQIACYRVFILGPRVARVAPLSGLQRFIRLCRVDKLMSSLGIVREKKLILFQGSYSFITIDVLLTDTPLDTLIDYSGMWVGLAWLDTKLNSLEIKGNK